MIEFENRVFHLQTDNTSYIIGIRGTGYPEQLYFGKKIRKHPEYKGTELFSALGEKFASGYGNSISTPERPEETLDNIGLEYSTAGTGDYRHLPLELIMPDGTYSCEFLFDGYRIYDGIYEENDKTGMPAAHAGAGYDSGASSGIQTLIVKLKDTVYDVSLELIYTVFPECDVITRRVRLANNSEKNISIRKIMSLMLDLSSAGYELRTFDGMWTRERHENVKTLVSGIYVNDSTTGASSNRHNPFIILSTKDCTQEKGECFGINLIYSGNHYEAVEVSGFGKLRVMTGISPHQFEWELGTGAHFHTPEAVLSFSGQGLNGLSENMHLFVNAHIIPREWAYKERPVLVNNWEATYFDFNESKLLKIADEAAKSGMELFVLDDGWFGKRSDDKTSLGDWVPNEKKLGGSLGRLARKINSKGLRFGLWFEPEMVSENSALFREHPDWILKADGRGRYTGRNQQVLDLTRAEVREYLVNTFNRILFEAPIEYVKWDMNRHIVDACSSLKEGSGNSGGFFHCYILGLYEVIRRITENNPNVLFEGCSSGGNRFDLGMLAFMPQIWTSDNTDPNERIIIQQGTSYGYPISAMGAHVSASPNHQTLRDTSIETRFNVACFGLLGYEIDMTKLTSAEKKAVKKQVEFYKEHRELFQFGTFMRIQSGDDNKTIWQVTSKDRKKAAVMIYQRLSVPNSSGDILRATGLLEDEIYEVTARRQFIPIKQFGNLVNQVSPVNITQDGFLQSAVGKFYMLESEEEIYRAGGDLIMNAGIKLKQQFAGTGYDQNTRVMGDFSSRIYILQADKGGHKDE